MSKSQVFLFICLAFTAGIFLSSFIKFNLIILYAGLITGILLISVFWSYKKIVVIGFCLLFLILGIWRQQTAEFKIINNELRNFNDLGQKITLIGIVSTEPDIRETHSKLTIDNIKLVDKPVDIRYQPAQKDVLGVSGNVLVTTGRYPKYQYGDKLKIVGELKTPPVFEDFNYKNFLAKDRIYSVIYWPKIELISKNQGNFIYAKILEFKNNLRRSIYQNLSPPQSSILAAMILGDQRKMSESLKEKLNITGIRHIVAISGMHIAILSIILMQFLIGLGLWRGQAFYLTISLLILFIIMVGFPSSAIRAGIMGGLFLLTHHLGRQNISFRTIVIAAAFMLFLNPLLLRLDVGFQLSFLATLGIIYLGPIFQNWFKKIPERQFFNLRSIISMTLSAQIFTLPILIYNFGHISLIAPLTNVLILPFVPFIFGAGFLFGLTGIFFQSLGQILSWPAWLLLSYLIKIVDWFSQIPWTVKTLENVHWIWLIISYLILGLIAWRLNEKQKLKFLNY